MGMFLESTGCGESTTNGLGPNNTIVKVPLQSGKNLHYNGPNLPATGVRTCDSCNEALQKMDAVILTLKQQVYELQQTLKLIK